MPALVRFYDSQIGRFLTPDPAGTIDSPNLYAYVLNDPINLTDPSGLKASIWQTVLRWLSGSGGGGGGSAGGGSGSDPFIPAPGGGFIQVGPIEVVTPSRSPPFNGVAFDQPPSNGNGPQNAGGRGTPAPTPMMMVMCPMSSVAMPGSIAMPGGMAGAGARAGSIGSAALGDALLAGLGRALGLLGAVLSLSGDTPQNTNLFRVVSAPELTGIVATGQFTLKAGGLEAKQFFFSFADSQKLSLLTANASPPPFAIVSVTVSNQTLALGERFSDVGMRAIAFREAGLASLNRDAAQNGVQVVQSCGGGR